MTCLPEDRAGLIEPSHPNLIIRQQCELLGVNRSSYYYQPAQPKPVSDEQVALLHAVDEVYTDYPFFGTRQMMHYLRLNGYPTMSRRRVRWAYQKLALKALAPGPDTSKPQKYILIY